MTLKAVLFDLDDTLHDRAGSLRAFVADQHRRRFATAVDAAYFTERFISLDANGHFSKSELYPLLLGELGISEIDPVVLADEYGETYHKFAIPRDNALVTLTALRTKGFKLGIVSNGWTDFQLRTLRASGLSNAVDAVLISEQEALRKPDRRLFERAAERLDVSTRDCLFVGDNPLADIDGARNAGMRTAWIAGGFAWPSGLPRANWNISTLSEWLCCKKSARRELTHPPVRKSGCHLVMVCDDLGGFGQG